MTDFIAPLNRLIEQFRRLPGVGQKSAERIAFSVLELTSEEADEFANAIVFAKKEIKHCTICGNYSVSDICPICADDNRDESIVCVVEDARAIIAFEKVKGFRGTYHVLGGALSPINGITPELLNINSLLARVNNSDIKEIIVATNPNVEGEATAVYLSKLLKPFDIKITRLAYGIPVGGDIEYADEVTLNKAIEGRRDI